MARETGLTMATILAWVGETSLARGRPYVDRLLDQRRTGLELKARCVGSAAVVYQTIAQTVLAEYTQLHDEEGSLHGGGDAPRIDDAHQQRMCCRTAPRRHTSSR